MASPLGIIVLPQRQKKRCKATHARWCGIETILTVAWLYCQLQKSLLIPLRGDLAHSPRHGKELEVKFVSPSAGVSRVRVWMEVKVCAM
jgi:hypothetical protein